MTAQELIKAALRKLGAIASGETPSASEMADGLEALKVLLRQWSSHQFMLYATTKVTHTLTGASSYTIGSGGDITATRPKLIKGASVTSSGLDYPLDIIDEGQYRRLSDKSSSGTPSWLYYNPGNPLGTIYIYPAGGGVLSMDTLIALTEPTALTTSVSFPGEYDAAIIWNLAVELAPEYGKEPTPSMVLKAELAKDDIIAINAANSVQVAELEILNVTGRWNINEG